MSLWALSTNLAGGLGIFLLGMSMMTDGLKMAAGPALQRILANATRTRWHALGSGMLVTALVQASGAVTVAAIGFVNAGLLSLGPALWVLFGANVGTTMTGWIIALIGLKFKIEALALPLIGAGVVLRLTGEGQRRGAIGSALAGFGLLFLGIAMLQESFTGLAGQVELPQGEGPLAVLAQVAIGALMTVLMQSSSASMAIALTAAQGGLLTAQGAAAVVIGANIGTTVTAMVAAIGATPNARRAAAAHVAFNVITALVALALLPWLIGALGVASEALGLPHDPATKLALFHSIFNILGVLLMWPLASPLTRWLQARFKRREDDEAQVQYLDDNVLPVPALAVEALVREVARVGHVAVRMAKRGASRRQPGRSGARPCHRHPTGRRHCHLCGTHEPLGHAPARQRAFGPGAPGAALPRNHRRTGPSRRTTGPRRPQREAHAGRPRRVPGPNRRLAGLVRPASLRPGNSQRWTPPPAKWKPRTKP